MVDDEYHCIGLITVKDIEKARAQSIAARTIRVGCGSQLQPPWATGIERTERLIDGGVDVIVVDTAHGHSAMVLKAVSRREAPFQPDAGDRGQRRDGRRRAALIDSGADADQGRHRPGLDLHDAHRRGVGVPQLTAILDTVAVADGTGTPVIADGGIKYSGDLAKALAAGASCRHGRLAARRHRREPGRGLSLPGPVLQSLSRHGFGRRDGARIGRSLLPGRDPDTAEARAGGRRGAGALQGPGANVLHQLAGRRLRAAMGYVGARTWRSSAPRPGSVRITGASLRESHAHDVTITRESPNYPWEPVQAAAD